MGKAPKGQEQPTQSYVTRTLSINILSIAVSFSVFFCTRRLLSHDWTATWQTFGTEDVRGVDGILTSVAMFYGTCQVLLPELEAGATRGIRESLLQEITEGTEIDCYICFALHAEIAESFTDASTVHRLCIFNLEVKPGRQTGRFNCKKY